MSLVDHDANSIAHSRHNVTKDQTSQTKDKSIHNESNCNNIGQKLVHQQYIHIIDSLDNQLENLTSVYDPAAPDITDTELQQNPYFINPSQA